MKEVTDKLKDIKDFRLLSSILDLLKSGPQPASVSKDIHKRQSSISSTKKTHRSKQPSQLSQRSAVQQPQVKVRVLGRRLIDLKELVKVCAEHCGSCAYFNQQLKQHSYVDQSYKKKYR